MQNHLWLDNQSADSLLLSPHNYVCILTTIPKYAVQGARGGDQPGLRRPQFNSDWTSKYNVQQQNCISSNNLLLSRKVKSHLGVFLLQNQYVGVSATD